MLQKRVVGTSMGRVCAETVVVAHLHTHTNSKDHASRIATRHVVCRPKLVECIPRYGVRDVTCGLSS